MAKSPVIRATEHNGQIYVHADDLIGCIERAKAGLEKATWPDTRFNYLFDKPLDATKEAILQAKIDYLSDDRRHNRTAAEQLQDSA